MEIIPRGADGYYHPASEDQLRALVVLAHDEGRSLRVRGSAHSTPHAIYTTGYDGDGPPPPADVEVMLDQYARVLIVPDAGDPRRATVEVEAGCHLGKDPYDPTKTSTWRNSLDFQLQRAGYALDDLGGITHQTVSGFFSTGSSGGSLTYSIHENLARVRFIDGTGAIHDVSRDDPDPDKRELFAAFGVSMGLLGVISKVWLRVGPSYNIFGSQVTAATDDLPFDMFGPGRPGKPGVVEFLQRTPYSRLMWWPQHDFERVQVWQAARLETMPDFTANPTSSSGASRASRRSRGRSSTRSSATSTTCPRCRASSTPGTPRSRPTSTATPTPTPAPRASPSRAAARCRSPRSWSTSA